MRRLAQILAILTCAAAGPSAGAKEQQRPALSMKLMKAKSVLIVCECPRAMAVAGNRASRELKLWGRFQIVEHRDEADIVLLFSANPYLGDYVTRDGPDRRPVSVVITFLTAIDPNTGENLWSDSRRWGSWRVGGATKDLIDELRGEIEEQIKKWTLDDILRCAGSPIYGAFADLTPEEALTKPGFDVGRIAGTPDRLTVSSRNAPEFCKRAQLVVGPENRIVAFEVSATEAENLDITDVLQKADQFDLVGGKHTSADRVYFTAQSKDKKIQIQFDLEGRGSVFLRVRYSY
jgi:hypothetical protein